MIIGIALWVVLFLCIHAFASGMDDDDYDPNDYGSEYEEG